jgi:hypothetical protein
VPCYRECDSVVVVGKLLSFQCFGNAFEDLGFESIERLVIREFGYMIVLIKSEAEEVLSGIVCQIVHHNSCQLKNRDCIPSFSLGGQPGPRFSISDGSGSETCSAMIVSSAVPCELSEISYSGFITL